MPEAPRDKGARKKIVAVGLMKKLMADHFYELDKAAKEGRPKVAWCTSVGPAELLRAMGFLVYFPENHGAVLGATRTANDYIPLANAIGYSPDICSYLTSDVGAFLKGETPLSKAYEGITSVPKPDVLVFNTNQCREVQDWFLWFGRRFKAPVIGVNSYRGVKDVTEAHVEGVAKQIEALVPTLEKVSGNKFDIDALRKTVALSLETTVLWKKVLETAAAVPSPITFFDGTIHMGPAVVLRGTQQAVDYYKALLPELEQRVAEKSGALENERHRLYWDGMPIWGKLREMAELFQSLNTNVVASTYCNSWIFDAFNPKDPFRSMARAYTELFIVRSDEAKEAYIESMVKKFKVTGILFHDSKTCPNNSNCRHGMPQRLKERLGIPFLVVYGDLNDLRCYSEEQAKTSIEAFVEQLER
ncbi:MAG: 2-hydroxyacyl-CoA dehydratase family protein [Planctomycetota bacterium]|nr:2-hydroxyacyl-CoA dehydratase family protein [Planctomycetota bacterium]